ncbi:hypothetical protein TNCT_494301 [Trichonephila clavata]|uniref:Uncharacterized protein n=1 Tax=Trichonephila clavata TaxID=2740835 RepID=A0A8X6FRI4_TRICU|nr:hypothetical protein TNCT_494301 [Trichonephila clavata]
MYKFHPTGYIHIKQAVTSSESTVCPPLASSTGWIGCRGGRTQWNLSARSSPRTCGGRGVSSAGRVPEVSAAGFETLIPPGLFSVCGRK